MSLTAFGVQEAQSSSGHWSVADGVLAKNVLASPIPQNCLVSWSYVSNWDSIDHTVTWTLAADGDHCAIASAVLPAAVAGVPSRAELVSLLRSSLASSFVLNTNNLTLRAQLAEVVTVDGKVTWVTQLTW